MNNKTHANTIIYLIATIIVILVGVLTIGLGIVAAIVTLTNGRRGDEQIMTILASMVGTLLWFVILSVIPFLVLSVMHLIEVYRMWNAIDDGQTRMTASKALGFLFIPFFSLYWIFQVWGGFPTDYNGYVNRHNLQNKVPLLESPLYTAVPVLAILSGFLIPLPILLVAVYLVMRKNNQAIDLLQNALGESGNQATSNVMHSPVFQQNNIAG